MAHLLHNLDWENWVYGIVAGFIGGGAGAVVSGVVVSLQNPQDYSLAHPKFYILVGSVFAANGLVTAAAFLKQNPLPKIITVTTTETTVKQNNPPAIVTTKVEETKVTTDPQ